MKKVFVLFLCLMLFMSYLYKDVKANENLSTDLSSVLTYHSATNSITLNGTVTQQGLITPGSRVNFFVLKPGETFEQEYTSNEMSEAICYFDNLSNLKEGQSFQFSYHFSDGMDYGKYIVRVTCTDYNRNISVADYILFHTSTEMVQTCVDSFRSVTALEFMNLIEYYTDAMGVFDLVGLEEIDVSKMAEMFILVRDGAKNGFFGDENKEISTPEDIKKYIKIAQLLNIFFQGTSYEMGEAYEKYAELVPYLFVKEIDFDNFKILYQDFKANWTTVQELCKNIRLIGIMSYMQNSSNEVLANAMEKYHTELEIDLAYATAKNVDLLEIAKYIDSKNMKSYVGKLGEFVKSTVDKIVAGRRSSTDTKVSRSHGGGGAGVIYPAKEVSPLITEEEQPEIIAKPLFKDLEGFNWAKDAIEELASKGIISGVGESKFEPDRYVTREEFVKMLVLAFDFKSMPDMDMRFVDCDVSNWSYPYIGIAYANGIISGISKYEFGVGEEIKRQDAGVMCKKIIDIKKPFTGETGSIHFADNEDIDEYARESIIVMVNTGVINGFDTGRFNPHLGATRAQAAVIIDRLITYLK